MIKIITSIISLYIILYAIQNRKKFNNPNVWTAGPLKNGCWTLTEIEGILSGRENDIVQNKQSEKQKKIICPHNGFRI